SSPGSSRFERPSRYTRPVRDTAPAPGQSADRRAQSAPRRSRRPLGAWIDAWSRRLRDVRVVDALHIGKREAGLRSIVGAARIGGARRRREWQAVASQIAEAMALEEQLATALFDDLRLELRRGLARAVEGRQADVRRARRVDGGNRSREIAGRRLRLGD